MANNQVLSAQDGYGPIDVVAFFMVYIFQQGGQIVIENVSKHKGQLLSMTITENSKKDSVTISCKELDRPPISSVPISNQN